MDREIEGLSAVRNSVSTVPYAIIVPVLVVMAQSAWVAQRGGSLRNALLSDVSSPVVLVGMVIIAVISFYVIRPFMLKIADRWIATLTCVLGFTILLQSLFLGTLAE